MNICENFVHAITTWLITALLILDQGSTKIFSATSALTVASKEEINCKDVLYDRLDLFILLDSSSSIERGNFTKMLHFVQQVVDDLHIGPNDTQVGLLQFNGEYNLEFSLNEYKTKAEILEALTRVDYMEGVTYTGKALRYVVEYEIRLEKGSREGVPQVVVVITDGFAQDDVVRPSNLARRRGIDIIAVGITREVNIRQMLELAGGQSGRVFLLDDFESFRLILKSLISQIHRAVNEKCYDKTFGDSSGFVNTSISGINIGVGDQNGAGVFPMNITANSTIGPGFNIPVVGPNGTNQYNISVTDLPLTTDDSSSIPVDPEHAIQNVDLRCDDGRMQILVRFATKFHGWIYVKDHFHLPTCRWNYFNSSDTETGLLLKYDQCDVKRTRVSNPKGIAVSSTIIIMKHPMFLTKGDRAFRLQCFYMEAQKYVTNSLDVSLFSTLVVTRNAPMPTCQYTLRSETLNGPVVKASVVGRQVFHRWECETSIDGTAQYGMKVHSCFVKSNGGSKRALIVDENGCILDKYLFGKLNYSEDLLTAYAPGEMFKFADSDDLSFDCQITLCLKDDNGCSGITPPSCPEPVKGKKRSVPVIFDGQLRLDDDDANKFDISSDRIIVIDFLYPKSTDNRNNSLQKALALTYDQLELSAAKKRENICLSNLTLKICILSLCTLLLWMFAVLFVYIFYNRAQCISSKI